MGNWTTDKETIYKNVRLVGETKFFAASGEGKDHKPAATFFPIIDGTKGGEDIFVDVKVVRGAERLAGLKKGQEVTVTGTVEFKLDNQGKMRGKIWDARVSLPQATRDALKLASDEAAAAAAEAAAADAGDHDEPAADEAEAPAFE